MDNHPIRPYTASHSFGQFPHPADRQAIVDFEEHCANETSAICLLFLGLSDQSKYILTLELIQYRHFKFLFNANNINFFSIFFFTEIRCVAQLRLPRLFLLLTNTSRVKYNNQLKSKKQLL